MIIFCTLHLLRAFYLSVERMNGSNILQNVLLFVDSYGEFDIELKENMSTIENSFIFLVYCRSELN